VVGGGKKLYRVVPVNYVYVGGVRGNLITDLNVLWTVMEALPHTNIFLKLCIELKPDHENKKLSWGQHWFILTFDVSTFQEFYMKGISSMDFPQHGEVFYFNGQTLNE
jgi:hypothetical protein